MPPSPAGSPPPGLPDLLRRLATGEVGVEDVLRLMGALGPGSGRGGFSPLGGGHGAVRQLEGATLDLGRESRCGYSEVIFGEGKSAELITEIIRSQLEAGQRSLVTRIDPTAAAQVRRCFELRQTHHNPVAHTLRVGREPIGSPSPLVAERLGQEVHVAVVTAGSTDAAIAEEAIETLRWMEIPYQRFEDIGVAGPQRLLHAVPSLRLAAAVVVVAGMEGALPAAVAGHVAAPVFAVPTSVGYGASLGGMTALLGMLNSCAANVAVVNIDAGFKGGYLAGTVAGQLIRQRAADGVGPPEA